ncbi:MAG: phosphoribosylformylglycinamidine synthase [Bacillota bacterium]
MNNYRIYASKKTGYQVEAEMLKQDFNQNLGLNITSLELIVSYDVFGISSELLEKAKTNVFSEVVTDTVSETIELDGKTYFATEFLPGQFDARGAAAAECIKLIDAKENVKVRSGKILIFEGVEKADLETIKSYFINKIESREKDLAILQDNQDVEIDEVPIFHGFTKITDAEISEMRNKMGLAMADEDLKLVRDYFASESRDPSETEIRMLDTYWSDHCRHTTFETKLEDIQIENSIVSESIKSSLEDYMNMRVELGREAKEITLMDIATVMPRYLKHTGDLADMEVSEENNACSVVCDIEIDGVAVPYLIMFKNETHNHPTEIEPFGGASTCIGGAIRDPLSGRSYVYQAMRVTGAGNIWADVSETISNKLPQRIISKKAAEGYSSYGNQIGLATTFVKEVYHEGFVAKRMEVGACLGAVPVSHVRRESVASGDIIVMFGGRTGRDGIGGATGSSKEHNETSLEKCSSEVQKGNAPEERKIQHLFRRGEVTKLVKKSNDFGAGGVSVAIGELADSLEINLDAVQTKYAGLNATEIAISESQERMSVVLEPKDVEEFLSYCKEENLEAYVVAKVTDSGRLRMTYGGKIVVDLSRDFINTNGARQVQNVTVLGGDISSPLERAEMPVKEAVETILKDKNVQTQKGLSEMFDATIGGTTVLMPFGGKYQLTETSASVQKVQIEKGYTDATTVMSYGYDPEVSSISPYLGAQYAILDSVAKAVAVGGKTGNMHFSFQEYFERLGKDKEKWGKPLEALLGSVYMQKGFKIAAIGGKDSMSGTFKDITVPPTLISFTESVTDANIVVSQEFKKAGSNLYIAKLDENNDFTVNTEKAMEIFKAVESEIQNGNVLSAREIGFGGVIEAVSKMTFGNKIGAGINFPTADLAKKLYGSFIIEAVGEMESPIFEKIGETTSADTLTINGDSFPIETLISWNFGKFAKIYPVAVPAKTTAILENATKDKTFEYPYAKKDVVKVFIPIFPGSNCDYDTKRAFEKEGAIVQTFVFCNLNEEAILESIAKMEKYINETDVLAFCGGFSSGDEPDGSGKFIANVILNEKIQTAITALIARKGLILGICNGFQALVKSGLLPYGKFGMLSESSPTLFRNDINRHISLIAKTVVAGNNSPWLAGMNVGDTHEVAFSHGEGKFCLSDEMAKELFENGMVCFQYANLDGVATMDAPFNPNGSAYAIEGITSADGLILGKMGHSERYENNIYKNIEGEKHQNIFKNAVAYFTK